MKKIILVSFILVLLGFSASYAAPPAGTLSMDWSVVSTAIGEIRSATFNPFTGNMLLTVSTGVIVIDGNNGAILGSLQPGSVTISSLFGICVDEAGVIYAADYGGAGQIVRWVNEADAAPISAAYPTGMGVPRGFRALGSGVNTIIFQSGATGGIDADNGPLNILTTSDGTTFTVTATTADAAAKTGVAVTNAGNTLYGFRPWGTTPIQEGVTKWDNIVGWVKDVGTFLPDSSKIGYAVDGDIDPIYNALYVYNYTMSTVYTDDTASNGIPNAADTITAIDPITGAYITRLYIGTNGSYAGGLGVDRSTHKIYWAARNEPSAASGASSWGRMTYTIPLAISIDSVNMGPTGSVVLTAEYGTAPYSWTTSVPGIVSLSSNVGSSVIVSAVAPGTVDVILTDNAAVSKKCTVVVVPTSTGIWSDRNKVIIYKRQPMGELFE